MLQTHMVQWSNNYGSTFSWMTHMIHDSNIKRSQHIVSPRNFRKGWSWQWSFSTTKLPFPKYLEPFIQRWLLLQNMQSIVILNSEESDHLQQVRVQSVEFRNRYHIVRQECQIAKTPGLHKTKMSEHS